MSGVKSVIVTVCAVLCSLSLVALVTIQFLARNEIRDAAAQLHRDVAEPHYEYKVLAVEADNHNRNGDAAMRSTEVNLNEKELSLLGARGWEVVGSYLEMETAFPNFGKAEYVTGLQPNVRPQRVVLVLRHRIG